MKKVQLLSTVAATLLLTVGAVSAQQMKKDEAPARAPAAQQNAPAEKVAPRMNAGEHRGPATTGQATPDTHRAPSTTGQASPETKSNTHKAPETNGQAAPKSDMDQKSRSMNNEHGNKAVEHEKGAERSQERSPTTTGQGAAAGSAKLSNEQRSKITTIIHRHKVAPVHLNVAVRVGTRIPASVHFYPLPVEVVDIYPEWRGYDYILVGDEILVLDPRTHEIVAILEA